MLVGGRLEPKIALAKTRVFYCHQSELELENAENLLQSRIDRKKDYRAKTLEIAERRRRKWMV